MSIIGGFLCSGSCQQSGQCIEVPLRSVWVSGEPHILNILAHHVENRLCRVTFLLPQDENTTLRIVELAIQGIPGRATRDAKTRMIAIISVGRPGIRGSPQDRKQTRLDVEKAIGGE
jgi:hypothetical protein